MPRRKRLAAEFVQHSAHMRKLLTKADEEEDENDSEDSNVPLDDNSSTYSESDSDNGFEKELTMESIEKGDYVVVKYTTKLMTRNFVGSVTGRDSDEASLMIKFLQRRPHKFGHRFAFPDKDEYDKVPIHDVIAKLPPPTTVGGTQRASAQLVFGPDLEAFTISM